MLDGVEQASVNIEIGVAFLHGNFVPFGFENGADGSGGDAFPYSGENTTGNEDVFGLFELFVLCHVGTSCFPPSFFHYSINVVKH